MTTLEQFIFARARNASSTEPATHTSKVPSRSYIINGDDAREFMDLYKAFIADGKKCCMTEMPTKFGPLRVDFDIRQDNPKRLYTIDHLKQLVRLYQTEMEEIVEHLDETLGSCLVLEKKSPRKHDKEGYKDGFHLHFPEFICEAWMGEYLRERVASKIDNIFKDLKMKSYSIDKEIMTKPWWMYGSASALDAPPYHLTKGFDKDCEEVVPETLLETNSAESTDITYELPELLSIRGYEEQSFTLKESFLEKQPNRYFKKTSKKKDLVYTRKEEDILRDLRRIKDGHIMDMLSEERADNRDMWIQLGITLYGIGDGHPDFLDLWITFSMKNTEKFVEGECERLWDTFEKYKGRNIASLLYMARIDDPPAFAEWKKFDMKALLEDCIFINPKEGVNEGKVADVFVKVFEGQFKCSSAKRNEWYEFKNHRWQKVDDDIGMRMKLDKEIYNIFVDLEIEINTQKKGTVDSVELDKIKARAANCRKVQEVLRKPAFQKKVIASAMIKMHDPKFDERKNANVHLFCCENGVLDLKNGIFREGSPDDDITFTCGLRYEKNLTEEDDIFIEMMDYFKRTYPEERIRNFFFDFACKCLRGENTEKQFILMTGPMNGGKSAVVKLLEYTFSSKKDGYMIKFPKELFVLGGKNSSSGPRAELARAENKRIAGSQEVTNTQQFDTATIKELTSGLDSQYVRKPYDPDGMDMMPTFTLFMQCNDPPSIPNDDAFVGRMRFIDHNSRFGRIEDPAQKGKFTYPPEDPEEQERLHWYPALDLTDKLKEYAPYFLWFLFQRYKIKGGKRIDIPDQVNESATRFKIKNDIYYQFYDEKVVTVSNQASFVTLMELYDEYKGWVEKVFLNKRIVSSKIAFRDEMLKKIGPMGNPNKDQTKWTVKEKNSWYGIQLQKESE